MENSDQNEQPEANNTNSKSTDAQNANPKRPKKGVKLGDEVEVYSIESKEDEEDIIAYARSLVVELIDEATYSPTSDAESDASNSSDKQLVSFGTKVTEKYIDSKHLHSETTKVDTKVCDNYLDVNKYAEKVVDKIIQKSIGKNPVDCRYSNFLGLVFIIYVIYYCNYQQVWQ